jgi:hypothetical protein
MLIFTACSSDKTEGIESKSSKSMQAEEQKDVTNNGEMDDSEFTFWAGSDDKTCIISIGDEEPKHSVMRIPSENEGRTVTEIHNEGFKNLSGFNTLIIPDTVTKIGYEAFLLCPDLETVEMGNGVNEIGDNVFLDCKKLKNVTLSNSITEIPMGLFQGCAIEKVVIPSGVQKINCNAFADCQNLKEVHIPETVKEIVHLNGPFEKSPNVTIYAPKGSFAEKYAVDEEIPFIAE